MTRASRQGKVCGKYNYILPHFGVAVLGNEGVLLEASFRIRLIWLADTLGIPLAHTLALNCQGSFHPQGVKILMHSSFPRCRATTKKLANFAFSALSPTSQPEHCLTQPQHCHLPAARKALPGKWVPLPEGLPGHGHRPLCLSASSPTLRWCLAIRAAKPASLRSILMEPAP